MWIYRWHHNHSQNVFMPRPQNKCLGSHEHAHAHFGGGSGPWGSTAPWTDRRVDRASTSNFCPSWRNGAKGVQCSGDCASDARGLQVVYALRGTRNRTGCRQGKSWRENLPTFIYILKILYRQRLLREPASVPQTPRPPPMRTRHLAAHMLRGLLTNHLSQLIVLLLWEPLPKCVEPAAGAPATLWCPRWQISCLKRREPGQWMSPLFITAKCEHSS